MGGLESLSEKTLFSFSGAISALIGGNEKIFWEFVFLFCSMRPIDLSMANLVKTLLKPGVGTERKKSLHHLKAGILFGSMDIVQLICQRIGKFRIQKMHLSKKHIESITSSYNPGKSWPINWFIASFTRFFSLGHERRYFHVVHTAFPMMM